MEQTANDRRPIRVGVSMCLLGEKVRFDAGHKKDAYLTDVLGRHFEWVMVCPELEAGMGGVREAVRLRAERGGPRHGGGEEQEGLDGEGRRVLNQVSPGA